MFVKSMVIDGFKSYGTRTEINGFDPMFNAITGLNGSGKSNILDAICFLLGITNLTHVRAANLQELVYKNGQAGVTKATVSITFDNRDKKQSPLGYEHYDEITITRQVVIGGKNKYLINGSNVQNSRVSDLFRSVQLNVNNPHFLIMQGRITKVLNMKPPEILAMIEEAAGTRMYEAKKQVAEKTIEKKDAKLKEINNILAEEINPTLSKLKEERSAYLEFQKIQRELEHLNKLYVAYKFVCAEEASSKSDEELNQVKRKLQELQETIRTGEKEIQELDRQIDEFTRIRDREITGELMELETALKDKEKHKAKISSNLKTLKENIKSEERKRKQAEKSIADDKKMLSTKEQTLGGMQDMFDALRAEDTQCQAALKAAQERHQAISLGQFASEGGESATLQEQIMQAKKEISAAETEIKTADMKIKDNTEQLKKKQIDMKKTEAEYKRDSGNLGKFEAEVRQLEERLGKINYVEGTSERLTNDQRQLRMEVNGLRSQVEGMEARYPSLSFQYSDPERGFDRRKVRGVAAKLFTVREGMFCQALNTAAGGKLYNVVIDTEEVGKQLLQRGNLQRRVTFIPLNKINPHVLNQAKINAAKKIGGRDNVWWARELVDAEDSLQGAMNYLFGNVFVCRDLNTAERVAFDRDVNTKCVTLDGDVISPGGDMSGGAPQRGDCVLDYIFSMKETEQQLAARQQQLAAVEHELSSVSKAADQWNQLAQQLELKQHELELVRGRLQQTLHHQLKEEVEKLQEDTRKVQEGVEQARVTVKEGTKKVKDLEYKISNAKELKEKELKAADAEVKKCKKAAEESQKKWSSKEQEETSIKMEIDSLKKSIESTESQLEALAAAMKTCEADVEEANQLALAADEQVKEAEQEVQKQKQILGKQNAEITAKTRRVEEIKKGNSEKGLEIQETEHNIKKAVETKQDADRRLKHMLEEYDWIQAERQFFGQPNTIYDFKVTDPREAGRRIQKLEETKEKLKKNVNTRAMNMFSKAEEQYTDLIKRKQIVEADKAKINETIKELDIKKKEALRKAWDQVNKDFGSIFSTLLRGASAKLEPPEGRDVLEGLEVRVAFGGVWKESLTELSGGQRSLVALSLILSLLLFKPAPLYILDEVDAALDLSHTQNIGNMLKTHFKSSQFIVVSLKDGMFNNANVLFRTKFVDGMSTVSRTVQAQNMAPARK